MRRARFGRTEEEVSAIGVGTWSYGGARTVKGRDVGWSGHSDSGALAALRRAWESGINHWDTADAYGDGASERLIGSLWDDVPREDIFLATKVGWLPGEHRGYYHPQQIRKQLDASLANLQTDVIDLYYFHHCDFGPQDRRLDDAIDLIRGFRDEGKIRFIGLSDWRASKILRLAPIIDPDVVQPYRNVLDNSYVTSGLAAYVASHDLGVALFSPLKHGVLLGKYDQPQVFEDGDLRNQVPEFSDAGRLAHFRRVAAEMGRRYPDHPQPVLHALVDALLADSPTGSVLLGQRNRAQATAAATLGEPMSVDEALAIARLYHK